MPCRRAPRDGRWEASYLNVPAFPLRAPVDAAEMYCLTATTFQHLVRRGPGNVIVFVVLLGSPRSPFGDQGMVSCCATRAAVCLLEGEGLLAHDTGSNLSGETSSARSSSCFAAFMAASSCRTSLRSSKSCSIF